MLVFTLSSSVFFRRDRTHHHHRHHPPNLSISTTPTSKLFLFFPRHTRAPEHCSLAPPLPRNETKRIKLLASLDYTPRTPLLVPALYIA